MNKEQIEVLEKNGIDFKRIESLRKSLNGYPKLKEELTKLETLIAEKDKEIEQIKKTIKESNGK